MDNWKDRREGMTCARCVYYVPKGDSALGRCRRHAPTMKGFVPVFETDWCGDHRLDESLFIKADTDKAESTC